MRRLVFIDDDQTELAAFGGMVGTHYHYTTIHWARESAKLFSIAASDIFVSDLYLPSPSGDVVPTRAQRDAAAEKVEKVAERFLRLYSYPLLDDKARLQETMKAISDAFAMLKLQWSALGQSPDHGIALLTELKARHPEVPFVFYSRKMTRTCS